MQVATLLKGNAETGDLFIILPRKEAQDMYNVYVKFCEANPRQKNAKKVLKQMENEFCCW